MFRAGKEEGTARVRQTGERKGVPGGLIKIPSGSGRSFSRLYGRRESRDLRGAVDFPTAGQLIFPSDDLLSLDPFLSLSMSGDYVGALLS